MGIGSPLYLGLLKKLKMCTDWNHCAVRKFEFRFRSYAHFEIFLKVASFYLCVKQPNELKKPKKGRTRQ